MTGNRAVRISALVATIAVAAIVSPTVRNASAAPAAGCTEGPPGSTGLSSVAIVPHSRQAWAVGDNSVIVHRTHGWHRVAAAKTGVTFKGVVAPSRHSIWAVGFSRGPTCQPVPVLEHSRGGAFHTVPIHRLRYAALTTIAASGPDNVWVAGERVSRKIVVLHYDGKTWRTVSVAQAATRATVYDIATSGPNNVWLLGIFSQTVVAHFDGRRWRNIPLPDPDPVYFGPAAIATAAAGQTWISGSTFGPSDYTSHTLIVRWNGNKWTRMATPNPTKNSSLTGIATSGGRVVAVGEYGVKNDTSRPIVLHLVRHKWRRAPARVVQGDSYLGRVAINGKHEVAVGSWVHEGHVDSAAHAVIETPRGGTWRPVPTSLS